MTFLQEHLIPDLSVPTSRVLASSETILPTHVMSLDLEFGSDTFLM